MSAIRRTKRVYALRGQSPEYSVRVEGRLAMVETELDYCEKELKDQVRECNVLRTTIAALQLRNGELVGDIKKLNEDRDARVKELEEELEREVDRAENLERRLQGTSGDQKELADLRKQVAALNSQLADVGSKMKVVEEERVETNQWDALRQHVEDWGNGMHAKGVIDHEMQSRITVLTEQLTAVTKERDAAVRDLQFAKLGYEQRVVSLTQKVAVAEADLAKACREREDLRERCAAMLKKLPPLSFEPSQPRTPPPVMPPVMKPI